VCSFLHGSGFTGTGENRILGKVRVSLTNDGKAAIYAASTEMGQGEQTAFRRILADTIGVDPSQVIVVEVNTDLVPDSGPTVASRTTMVVGSLLVEAGKEIIHQLSKRLADEQCKEFTFHDGMFRCNGNTLSFAEAAKQYSDITVEKQYQHPPFIQFDDVNWKGDAYPVFSWGAAVAEIEVDPITFEIRVTRYTTTQDIGKAINHDQAIAQIQGGSLQGIGYALYEKVELKDGRFDVTGFTDYIIPTTEETPVFDIKIMENPYPYGPFGAKGLGELPFAGAAPAVLSALWMIFGKEFSKIPVLPEDLAALFQQGQEP
jgi:CO/xanthine dehydrogenase Mo-binding subunit